MEVWTFIDDYTTFARLWNIESLNLVVCHGAGCSATELKDVIDETSEGDEMKRRSRQKGLK